MRHLWILAITGFTYLSSTPAVADACAIEVWTRKPGSYVNNENYPRPGLATVALGKLKAVEKTTWDGQYGKQYSYKGVPLKSIISASGHSGANHAALLHFDNGMIVPQDSHSVFVATAYKKKKLWSNEFPIIAKSHFRYKDPRPTTFNCNKAVVSKRLGERFSPWTHTTSLTGIELVKIDAYNRQFLPQQASEKIVAGHKVFLRRCQYCHGIKNVGATFGWDYHDPLKTHEKRDKQSLLYHIQSDAHDKLERGLKMPAQPGVSSEDVDALWEWMKAASTGKLQPYQP